MSKLFSCFCVMNFETSLVFVFPFESRYYKPVYHLCESSSWHYLANYNESGLVFPTFDVASALCSGATAILRILQRAKFRYVRSVRSVIKVQYYKIWLRKNRVIFPLQKCKWWKILKHMKFCNIIKSIMLRNNAGTAKYLCLCLQ
jgi:hypothetical protein